MKSSPASNIDAQSADALFSDPQALKTLLQSDIPDALIEPETPMAIESETPVAHASESPVAAQAERLPEKLVSPRAKSIMERTITTLKKSFGVGQQRTRRRPSFAFANIEGLEPRMLKSGVAAEVGMLDPSDVSWSQGKNDATQVLGKADILPGCNLYDVAISPDGTKAVVTGQFSKASIIDTKTGTVITPLAGHTSSVMSAAWAPDGSALFTASYDKRVRHYAADGSLIWASGDVGELAVGVDVSPDGKTLFVRRNEIQPLVVDIATKTITTLNAPYYVGDLDVLADGTVLLLENDTRQYRGANNRVHIMNPATGTTEWTGSLSGMQPTKTVATPNGAYVFAGMDDGSIIMHDRAKGTSVSVAGHSSYVRDLAMDTTGTFLIAATNGSLNVFDVEPLMAGTGNAVPTSFPLGSSSVTVSGTVALINNTYDGASSRTLAIDLSQVPNLQARLDALAQKDEPEEDITEAPTEPVTETRMETVTEAKKIDFSSLEQGVHPESWTTTIDGLGKVTMWFQGGVKVGSNGISAVTQPLGGTGFYIKFNDGPVKVLSAEMQYDPTTQGLLRIQDERGYIYENGKILGWPLAPTVDLGGRSIKLFDGGQNSGKLSVKSLTVEVTVTREVKIAPPTPDEEEVIAEQEEIGEVVLAPVTVSVVKNASNAAQGIFITSPFDESYLMSEHYGLITAQHKGGAKDLMIFNNYLSDMMSNVYGNKTKTLTLYADKEMQIPVSEITFIGNRNFGVQLLSAIAQPVQKSMLPEGQEYEKAPEFHVAHLEGPNVILEVSSPLANSTIQFVDVHAQSLLGHATVIKNPDGGMSPVSITMNPANATGDYNLIMKGADGRVFGRALLHWDKDTKQLSLPEGQTAWTASEADQLGLDAAMAGLKTSLVDFTTSDRALAAIQQEILLTAASSMPGMSHDFDAAFFRAHPEWAPALRECASPSQLQQFNDTYGILRADFSTFQGLLGDLLKQSSKLITDIRNGGNETELRRLFDITVDKYATSLPMYRLASIGIRMPIGSEILEGAKNAGNQTAELLYAMKHKNLMQTMHKQTYANNGLVVSRDGTYMVSNDPRLETMKYYVDTEGRLSLQNSIGSRTLVAGTNDVGTPPAAAKIKVKEVDGHIDLGKQSEIRIPQLSLRMQPIGYKVITFELTQEDMVNIDIPGVDRNLSLTIQGNSLPAGGYTSNKSRGSAESASLRLPAGRYTVTIQDTTNYGTAFEFGRVIPKTPFDLKLNIDAQKFNSANIEGEISIEGSEKVMPVRMRVAEFDDVTGKRKEFKDVQELDPSKPVWVVVHGMDDDETGAMERVAKVLKEYPNMQLVIIDWKEAADATLKSGNDAPWTKGVGAWIGARLISLGFDPQNINFVGHSHGTYVGYAMAQKVISEKQGAQINAFVALDPAGNVPLVSGFTIGDMNFSEVSRNSIAFEGSLVAGNNALAGTADLSFQIDSPSTLTPLSEHALPVETFISLMRLGRLSPSSLPENLRLDKILTPIDQQTVDLQRNVFRSYYEGIITIDTRKAFDAYDKEYLFALPKSITTRHNGDGHDDFDTLPPVDSIFA